MAQGVKGNIIDGFDNRYKHKYQYNSTEGEYLIVGNELSHLEQRVSEIFWMSDVGNTENKRYVEVLSDRGVGLDFLAFCRNLREKNAF